MAFPGDRYGYPVLPPGYGGPLADYPSQGGMIPPSGPLGYDPRVFGGAAPKAGPAWDSGPLGGLDFSPPESSAPSRSADQLPPAPGARPVGGALPVGWSIVDRSPTRRGVGDRVMVDPPGDDTPAFSIPRGGGLQGVGPGKGYHAYRAETSTPAADHRTFDAIANALVRRPTLDPRNRAASAMGASNDGGISIFPGRFDDKVKSYLTRDVHGNQVVVNVTVPGEHLLNPGYVAQYMLRTPEGIRIVTAGEGNAQIQQGFGAALGSTLFDWKNERLMRKGIYEASRRR